MRYSKDHKHTTRQRILATARQLFAAKGYEATSIDAIMHACGLTRGGFYRHYGSKGQLYRAAMDAQPTDVERYSDQSEAVDDDAWIEAMLDEYLSVDTTAHNPAPSRIAFLATDVAHPHAEVRSAYTRAFMALSEELREQISSRLPYREPAIYPLTAMLIGAIAIVQTADDVPLKAELVAACRRNAKALLLDNPYEEVPPVYFWITTPFIRDGSSA